MIGNNVVHTAMSALNGSRQAMCVVATARDIFTKSVISGGSKRNCFSMHSSLTSELIDR
jgi:hypothetical protein